ncbi:MAG: hypothetical protein AB7S65_08485 [Sulfuricurvum sp.]
MFRPILLALSLIGAAALACGNPSSGGCASSSPSAMSSCSCGCGMNGTPILETITYALGELGLSDNGDIRTAIKLYKKEMRAYKPKLPSDAFADGAFHPDLYAKSAAPAHALQAQSDLFETIYLVLNDAQKQEFPKLMGMYEHHMEFTNLPHKMCGASSMPASMCSTAPTMKGCSGKNCKMPMPSPKR